VHLRQAYILGDVQLSQDILSQGMYLAGVQILAQTVPIALRRLGAADPSSEEIGSLRTLVQMVIRLCHPLQKGPDLPKFGELSSQTPLRGPEHPFRASGLSKAEVGATPQGRKAKEGPLQHILSARPAFRFLLHLGSPRWVQNAAGVD
jgi:hypothetical protein